MRKIVFDVETKNVFQDVGSNDPAKLDLSLIAIYDSETDSYSSYLEEELPKLWPILEKADVLIGFNSNHFDIPLLNKYYPGDLSRIKSIDLLHEVKKSYGRRVKLDHLAAGTLGTQKSGHGLDAIMWWKKGEIDKIRKYCIDDVRITKELYDYALKHGKLIFKIIGEPQEVTIDTAGWEAAANHTMTHTLPF